MDLSDDQLAELERIRGWACCMEPERRFMAEIENAALKRENEVFRQGCGMDGCKMPDIVKLLSYVLTAEEQE